MLRSPDKSPASLLTRRQFAVAAVVALSLRALGQAKPRRIVSTAPSITESLFALGFGDQVVGVSRFCDFPAAVHQLPKVGTYLKPDAEAIARLFPDLVILERISSELTDRLHALRIVFLEVPHGTLKDIFRCNELIAQAVGVPERASQLDGRMQRELAAIEAKGKAAAQPRVLIVVDRRPGMLADLTAAGPNNYLAELLQIAGGTNVLGKTGLPPYPAISLETVLREDPDVIVDLGSHETTEAERTQASAQVRALWGKYPQLKAVRGGRVVVTSSNSLIVPGPRASEAAGILFSAIHEGRPV